MNTYQSFDALGCLDSETKVFDDGHVSLIDYDQAQTEPWLLTVRSYDTANLLIEDAIVFDSGASQYVYYDAAMTRPWSFESVRYDSAGRLDTLYLRSDNGDVRVEQYDTQNQYAWTQILTQTSARSSEQTVKFDDGSSVVSTSSQSGGTRPSTVKTDTSYDADGHLDFQSSTVSILGSGTRKTVIDYDNKNAYSWSSVSAQTSLDGTVLFGTDTVLDTGARITVQVDSFATTTELYDPGNKPTFRISERADGTSIRTQFDAAETAPWKSVSVAHDALGRQTSFYALYDDGAEDWSYYDVDQTQAWSAAASHRAAGSSQTTWTAHLDNGSVISGFDLI